MNILEELYYGNVQPDILPHAEKAEYMKLVKLREERRDKLLSSLTEVQKEALEKFLDTQDELDCNSRLQKFTYGFRLGALIMCEVFGDDNIALI